MWGDFKIFLFQSSADYDTGFSVSAQCFRKDDPVTPYTSCTWMLVISIQLCIFNFNSYKISVHPEESSINQVKLNMKKEESALSSLSLMR